MKSRLLAVLVASTLWAFSADGRVQKKARAQQEDVESTGKGPALLWTQPGNIASRSLFYGPGGEKDRPHSTYTFEKEDLDGTNPKFVVRDENGVKWKVKLGAEARPETVASRLVWSVGYFANEDYFVPRLKVENMPRLHRGQNLVKADGTVENVRLKRYLKGEKKIGTWKWSSDPFTETRELNGLRVMMALINNWDLKDENNSIYQQETARGPEQIYMISDLGASFGTSGPDRPHSKAKGNLASYSHSKFITKVTESYVSFQEPSRPSFHYLFNPPEYVRRKHLEWIGRRIPLTDARWVGQMLAQLSVSQIRDAFRAAGYPANEIEGFAGVVESRIAQLKQL